jgi:serine/threonine protein kinase
MNELSYSIPNAVGEEMIISNEIEKLREIVYQQKVCESSKISEDFSFPFHQIPILNHVPLDIPWDDFKNVNQIANGSHSNVFTANWKSKLVIIKMISEPAEDNYLVVKEFFTEQELLIRIQHKNVVKILGAGRQPRRFIVLELLDGGTLKDLFQSTISKQFLLPLKAFRKSTFTFDSLLMKARELAQALQYLHYDTHYGVTVLHRDLKPDNIGFDFDGTLKLFDFGLASCVRSRTTQNTAYEMTGYTGSLRYMAPEVVLKQPYTEKVDVYSFAILVWQMGRDRVPFKLLNKDTYIAHVVHGSQRPKLDSRWPPAFSQLLTACWDKDPQIRPSFDIICIELTKIINAENSGGSSLSGRSQISRQSSTWDKANTTPANSSKSIVSRGWKSLSKAIR